MTVTYRTRVGTPFMRDVPGLGRQRIQPVRTDMDMDYRSQDFAIRMVVSIDVDYLPGLVIPLRHVLKQTNYQTGVRTTTETRTRDLNSS